MSRFMKVDKMKLEEVITVAEEPLKDDGGEAPSASSGGGVDVDGMEVTRDAMMDAPAVPMDTDASDASAAAPENEVPTALKRTATDVEMDDLTVSTGNSTVASAVPNADTDAEMLPSKSTLSISRTESTILESQSTLIESQSTLASSSSSSLSPNPHSTTTTTTATPTVLLEDADKRFVSTFRGRTIHGLTVDLPPGYGGLVLRREGDDVMNPAFGVGHAAAAAGADSKGKGRSNPNGKGRSNTKGNGKGKEGEKLDNKKPLPRRGRLTRSAAISKPEVIVVEEEPAPGQDKGGNPDEGMADDTLNDDENGDGDIVDGALPDDDQRPVRRLIPHAQFSSFTLWHQDRPVDKGRDEYCRALTEWIALTHEVSLFEFSFLGTFFSVGDIADIFVSLDT